MIVSITKIDRKPHNIQSTCPKDGKRPFHINSGNWLLRFLRSVWDCQHHTDQPVTFTPPHMKRNGDRGSHRTHRTVLSIENTSLIQDHIKTNHVKEFPYLLWRNKHPNGENLDPGTNLPIYTQDTVPVDLVETMVAHVFWGSKTPTSCGIKCLALKMCTCLFCSRGALSNRTSKRCCCHATGVLLVEGHILDM